jgi:antitoxin component YwqK of YwqJK toxin-antitoxin module
MKRTTLFITSLVLIVGCSKPVDERQLVERGGLMYEVNTDKPFSGKTFVTYRNGQNIVKGSWKGGKLDGKRTSWYENGQKKYEVTYKDGEKVGLWTSYNRDGTVEEVKDCDKGECE